jgi:hypothetical protein
MATKRRGNADNWAPRDEAGTTAPPTFPLSAKLHSTAEGIPAPFQLNSRSPVPIETPLFSGHALVIVRPDGGAQDPFYQHRVFEGKRRLFEVQLQGRFKRPVEGVLFVGGEISLRQMQLGLLTKSIAHGLLRIVRSFFPHLHFSFGDREGRERPHIVSPLWGGADRLIVTPIGETPPKLGSTAAMDAETPAHRKSRRGGGVGVYDTEQTYTFSFNTSNIDLNRWRLRGLPLFGDVDLHNFWLDGSVSISIYEQPRGRERHAPLPHEYALHVEIGHAPAQVGPLAEATGEAVSSVAAVASAERRTALGGSLAEQPLDLLSGPADSSPEDDDTTTEASAYNTAGESADDDEEEEAPEMAGTARREEDREDVQPFCNVGCGHGGVASSSSSERTPGPSNGLSSSNAAGGARRGDPAARREPSTPSPASGGEVGGLRLSPPAQAPTYLSWCSGACPARFDAFTSRGSHHAALLVCIEQRLLLLSWSALVRFFPRSTLAAYRDASVAWWSPRLLAAEKQRRLACLLLDTWLASLGSETSRKQAAISLLQPLSKSLTEDFLARARQAPSASGSDRAALEGVIVRALSETHWREERASLGDTWLVFGKGKSQMRISLDEVVSCVAVTPFRPRDDSPIIAGLSSFEIATLGRVTHIMVAGEEARDRWVRCISERLHSSDTGDGSPVSSDPWADACSADPASFLHKSDVWRTAQRRVLNCRRFAFRGRAVDAQVLASTALRESCRLCQLLQTETAQGELQRDLIQFFDATSELKHCDISGLDSTAQLAFFLNLYHLMINHAYLLLGPPPSMIAWLSYFSNVAYHVGDELVSLAGLEHCILRAGMNRPTIMLSKLAIPNSRYPCALTSVREPRLNFAINCGSLGNPPAVPVYRPEVLDAMLDATASRFVSARVSLTADDKAVLVPMVCQWFAKDFSASGREKPTTAEVIRFVARFHSDQPTKERLLAAASSSAIIKHLPYSYRCRPLGLLSDDEALGLTPPSRDAPFLA